MSAIEISQISFISRGSGRNVPEHSSRNDNFRVVIPPLSRLNPLLMKLIWLIWGNQIQRIKTEGPATPATFATRADGDAP